MTVQLMTVTPRYIGTTAERTAMETTGLPVGSEFFESDTGLTYVFCGGTTWTKKLYPGSTGG